LKLSVIVPVYNAKAYLDACIKSILGQTFGDLELLLIDDGSTDASLAVCQKWEEQDSRVHVFHQENRGQAAARNVGLAHARGEWAAFVDADDTIQSGCFAGALAAAAGRQADVISFGFTYIGPDGAPRGTATVPSFYAADLAAFEPYFFEYRTRCFASPCKLYRRALIEQYAIRFDEALKAGEDTIFNFDVFSRAQGIVHVETPYYHYWQHNNASVTRSGLTDLWNPEDAALQRLDRFLRESGYDDIREKVHNDWLTNAAFNQLCQYSSAGTRFDAPARTAGLKALFADTQAHALLQAELRRQKATVPNLICRASVALKCPALIVLPVKLRQNLGRRNKA
jgi:glycosyltransferase involved in cell wall biosynthesis